MKAQGNIIKKYREQKGLSIKEVSERTKIRPYIIEALEAGNFAIMSPIYVKSFLKTLAQFLEFNLSEIELTVQSSNEPQTQPAIVKEPIKEAPKEVKQPEQTAAEEVKIITPIEAEKEKYKKKKPAKPAKTISFDDENPGTPNHPKQSAATDYAAMFKKANKPQISTTQIINYSAVAAIFVALVLIIYFTFFDEGPQSEATAIIQDQIASEIDTTIIGGEDKGLLNYFEEPDSLTLEAEAIEDCWMRIEMDGERMEELTIKAGQIKTWKAYEFFSISQGNVGGVVFKRNGKLLEPFGSRSSVVRNIKITKSAVLNANKEAQDSIRQRYKLIRKNSNTSNVPKMIQPATIKTVDPAQLIDKKNKEGNQ